MSNSSEPAVVVEGLQKSFGDHVALRGVDFTVPRGTVLGLLGPNGAGKTTTVSILATLRKPDAGRAFVAGHDVVSEAAAVRRSIMLTGQFAALDEMLTGRENLELFGRLLGLSRSSAAARASELLEQFDLSEDGGRRVGTYSGGMRRRIDIACGLVTRPEVVFLDEPTTGLDPRSRQQVWSLIADLKADGITTLLTTQYLEEADVLSDNIVVIDHGAVVAEGTAAELKQRTGGTHCEVVPVDPRQVPLAHELLADLEPAELVEGSDRFSLPAPNGVTTLGDVMGRLDAAGIELADLALRRPSLDDVFLALTGHRTEAPQDAPTASA
ncbi:daunorubicin/doxorubicin resistance ABC transporter ATP-binding protein DrrA [Aldersonia kunmingensis]|uniref:daunorubicin/doxorubicin resistance ABC transporter ATP-binding protein DrrA n=1 Tax=Aldersonia kunmingensis TaxID=408066 RepID=UPI00082B9756|nr:daunorubicin/doxorubicin resistance ABC transporter ATP-binding protein DrrA [Aldersonia kunmingensis]